MADRGRPFSLRRRLLLALLGAITLVWVAAAAYTYFDARHEINELLDAHLAQSASMLVAQAGHELEAIDLEHAPQLHERGRRVAFQIWERDGTLRLHSTNAPQVRLSPREEGFADAVIDGRGWRVFSTWDGERRFLVQVGERDKVRGEIAASVATNLLAPLLLALPVFALFVWFSIARALRPLAALGAQLEARQPDNLAPLRLDGAPPSEVAPLVLSLNALFGRIGRLIENERRFTADAAHELRTPLAALKTQAQVARGAAADAERRHALDNVIAGCDRAARLVEQLLTLARLEPEQFKGRREACDLRALAQQTIAELAPAALSRDIEIELAEGGPAALDGYPVLLGILLRNLLDNAIRYSPDRGTVRVEAADAGGGTRLTVTDEGPGIAPEERAKVGQRFYRILGSGGSGSGLGLSIVHRIAEIHGATVALDAGPAGSGLRVTVRFGRRGAHRPE
ncbi:MAG TPA: ATP-binding protein [Burkholderiales bacterium]|nr:ATP-binding protein [Burkholderiales bacterium]